MALSPKVLTSMMRAPSSFDMSGVISVGMGLVAIKAPINLLTKPPSVELYTCIAGWLLPERIENEKNLLLLLMK